MEPALHAHPLTPPRAMASAWRCRPVCTLIAARAAPAALLSVNGREALVATTLRPAPGAHVTLHHPEAGAVLARVLGGEPDRLRLSLAGDAAAVAFALAAVAADMSCGD